METLSNYNNVTVDLSGGENTNIVKTSTFEEAFLGKEEFSEARGKGRARRKARKLSKISDRQEVKQARRGGRQEARLGRRATRKSTKQQIRDDQQSSRQTRRANVRDERQTSREAKARRRMTDEESDQDIENYGMEQQALRDERFAEPQYEDSIAEEPMYEEESDIEMGYDENFDEPTYESDDEMVEDEENYSTEDEMFGDDFSGFSSEVTGKQQPPAEINAICMKIEWNNELISRLLDAKNRKENSAEITPKINEELTKRFDRVKDLETKLENFSGMSGENATLVKTAKTNARQERFNSIVPKDIYDKLIAKGVPPRKIKQWWKTVGCKKYASQFDGTSDEFGMTNDPIDMSEWGSPAYDYDTPDSEVINLTSNNIKENFSGVDGGTNKKISTKSIVIGAVIGFTAIFLIRKYNLLK